MFVQHLGCREIEVLLRDMYPPLPQRVHAGFRADPLQLRARAAVHFFGNFRQVNPPGEVHTTAVDAKDVGTRFNSVDARTVSDGDQLGYQRGVGGEREGDGGIEGKLTWEEGIRFFGLFDRGGEEQGQGYQAC